MSRHRPGCTCCACREFGDHFQRSAQTTDLGAHWTELFGNWHIDGDTPASIGQYLVCGPSAPALSLLRSEYVHPELDLAVRATVSLGTVNDQARLIIDYLDPDNYWYGLVDNIGISALPRISIWQRLAGVETGKIFASGISNSGGTFKICRTNGRIEMAAVSGKTVLAYVSTLHTPTSPRVALGGVAHTPSANPGLRFNNFRVERVDDSKCLCQPILCRFCENPGEYDTPQQYQVVFNGISHPSNSCCHTLNVVPFTLDFAGASWNSTFCTWTYRFPVIDCAGEGITLTMNQFGIVVGFGQIGFPNAQWRAAPRSDCQAIQSLLMPYFGSSGSTICNFTGSTATLSAL